MNELLAPKGKLVGLMFNVAFEKPGPPFGGGVEEYEKYFSQHFDFLQFDLAENSIPPRKGNEIFIELQKKKQ